MNVVYLTISRFGYITNVW